MDSLQCEYVRNSGKCRGGAVGSYPCIYTCVYIVYIYKSYICMYVSYIYVHARQHILFILRTYRQAQYSWYRPRLSYDPLWRAQALPVAAAHGAAGHEAGGARRADGARPARLQLGPSRTTTSLSPIPSIYIYINSIYIYIYKHRCK